MYSNGDSSLLAKLQFSDCSALVSQMKQVIALAEMGRISLAFLHQMGRVVINKWAECCMASTHVVRVVKLFDNSPLLLRAARIEAMGLVCMAAARACRILWLIEELAQGQMANRRGLFFQQPGQRISSGGRPYQMPSSLPRSILKD